MLDPINTVRNTADVTEYPLRNQARHRIIPKGKYPRMLATRSLTISWCSLGNTQLNTCRSGQCQPLHG